MKEINKTLGVISVAVLFIGVILQKSHLAGASVLLTLGALAVIAFFIVYLSMGIKQLSSELEKLYGTIGVISICISLLGLLWKMQNWAGGNIFVYVSLGGLLVASILLIIDSIKETDKNKQSIKTFFAFILIVLVTFLIMLAPAINIYRYI
jgi:hypothetical protein